jgi:hypothetical protein
MDGEVVCIDEEVTHGSRGQNGQEQQEMQTRLTTSDETHLTGDDDEI